MLESMYIVLYLVGFLSFCLGIEKRSLTFTGVSFVMFMILFGQAIWIDTPWIAATNATNYTVGNQQHMEMAVSASCWVFIIIDIIVMFYHFLGWWQKRRGDDIAMP